MMKKLKNINGLAAMMFLLPWLASAQQASITIVGLSGQNMTVAGSTLYLPAGSYLNHTGNLYFGINNVVAGSAGTTVTGATGSRLHLLGSNQLDAGSSATVTQLDVNGLALDVDVTSYNPQNLSLTDLSFGTVTGGNGANASFLRNFAFGTAHPFTAAAVSDNHVITNSNRFIIGASGTLTGYDASRYIVTNNNAGELRKLAIGNGGNFFFPIGRAEADYTPARMQVVSGGPADYYMNVRNFAESIPDENLGGYSSMPHVSRTWMIYASDGNTVASMDFIHPGTSMYEVNGYNRNSSNVIRFSGNGWTPNQPNDAENESLFGTPANYWAQQIQYAVPGVIGANSFYGKSNTLIALPVRFGDFVVTAQGCDAAVNWTTFAEQNLSHFVLERSHTNRANSWEPVRRVSAVGNSSTLRQYNTTDAKAIGGQAYYRLAIVENDGKVGYSPVRLINFNCRTKITGYPNPVRDYFTVLLPQGAEKYTIRVLNAIGQDVLPAQTRTAGSALLPTTKLAAGTYNVLITDSNGQTTILRMLKN